MSNKVKRIAMMLVGTVGLAGPAYAHEAAHAVVAGKHDHVHAAACGHAAIQHDGHTDYVHDGHLHHMHGDHADEHGSAPAK